MAKLVYSMMISLDGYTAERDGNFDWENLDLRLIGEHSFRSGIRFMRYAPRS